jgi:hypothetical protein
MWLVVVSIFCQTSNNRNMRLIAERFGYAMDGKENNVPFYQPSLEVFFDDSSF